MAFTIESGFSFLKAGASEGQKAPEKSERGSKEEFFDVLRQSSAQKTASELEANGPVPGRLPANTLSPSPQQATSAIAPIKADEKLTGHVASFETQPDIELSTTVQIPDPAEQQLELSDKSINLQNPTDPIESIGSEKADGDKEGVEPEALTAEAETSSAPQTGETTPVHPLQTGTIPPDTAALAAMDTEQTEPTKPAPIGDPATQIPETISGIEAAADIQANANTDPALVVSAPGTAANPVASAGSQRSAGLTHGHAHKVRTDTNIQTAARTDDNPTLTTPVPLAGTPSPDGTVRATSSSLAATSHEGAFVTPARSKLQTISDTTGIPETIANPAQLQAGQPEGKPERIEDGFKAELENPERADGPHVLGTYESMTGKTSSTGGIQVATSESPALASGQSIALTPALSGAPTGSANPVANPIMNPAHGFITASPLETVRIIADTVNAPDDRQDRVVVQLDPPELGRISIDFKFNAHGLQHVTITGDNPEALRQMRLMHFELTQALERGGLSSENMTFQQQQSGQQQAHQSAPARTFDANRAAEEPALVSVQIAARNAKPAMLAGGGLNIKL